MHSHRPRRNEIENRRKGRQRTKGDEALKQRTNEGDGHRRRGDRNEGRCAHEYFAGTRVACRQRSPPSSSALQCCTVTSLQWNTALHLCHSRCLVKLCTSFVSLRPIMEAVRSSCSWVAARASHVAINSAGEFPLQSENESFRVDFCVLCCILYFEGLVVQVRIFVLKVMV